MKTNKKTNKKSTKPAYVVDITDCENEAQMKLAFIEARSKNGFNVKPEELDFIVDTSVNTAFNTFVAVWEIVNLISSMFKDKTTPWYKKAWNWIVSKFK